MKYQFIPKDRVIFDYHDPGDIFYIMLAGQVDIVIPVIQTVGNIRSEYLS